VRKASMVLRSMPPTIHRMMRSTSIAVCIPAHESENAKNHTYFEAPRPCTRCPHGRPSYPRETCKGPQYAAPQPKGQSLRPAARKMKPSGAKGFQGDIAETGGAGHKIEIKNIKLKMQHMANKHSISPWRISSSVFDRTALARS
jgi:hypothetical protein